MQEIKVTVELCTEDRGRLDDILAALQAVGTPFPAPVGLPDAPITPETPQAEETPAPEVKEATAPQEAPEITAADIQRKVVALSAAGKKAEVKAIVNDYATKVSAIPEDKRAEVWERLNALSEGLA